MEDIADGLVAKAKQGDGKAIDSLLKIVGSGSKPAARSAPEQKPDLMMVESVGVDQLRKLAAYAIRAEKQMALTALCGVTGLDEEKLRSILQHPWFQIERGYYTLTPQGRQAI